MNVSRVCQIAFLRRCAVAAFMVGLPMGAMAQQASQNKASEAVQLAAMPAQQKTALTIRQIYDLVEVAGYRQQREIEWSDGHYEVKALNAQGRRVKLEMDPYTGAVLREQLKH